jgi:histidine ammonia-lyase
MSNKIFLNGNDLSIDDVYNCARKDSEVQVAKGVSEKLAKGRDFLKKLVDKSEIVYGITTGYGPLCNRLIPKSALLDQQKKLIYSLACGTGEPLGVDATRAIMIARANVLAKGNSGVRLSSLEIFIDMLNHHIHPIIYAKGSLGASGDLIHLGQLALAVIGEGKVRDASGNIVFAKDALAGINKKPVIPEEKEGLAFVNGTSAMTGIAALALSDMEYLLKLSELLSAFLIEVHHGCLEPFSAELHEVRPHKGQIKSASTILSSLKSSKMTRNEEKDIVDTFDKASTDKIAYSSEYYVQDPYSLRCVPQVLGAVRDLIDFCKTTITTELNSTTDNPVIITEKEKVIHGGNFYGQQISFCADILAMGITKAAVLAERQIDRLVNEAYNNNLPAMLVEDVGHNSGFAGAQMSATSLVVENRLLCTPVSVQSIPSNANNQDVVSMGTISARRIFEMVENLRNILAIEALCLAQAADFRGIDKFSENSRKIYNKVREVSAHLSEDRPLYSDIEKVSELIFGRKLFEFKH